MVARIEPCPKAQLQKAIDSSIEPRDEAELARHLERCPECRADLERLAAAGSWWSEARELLPNERTTRRDGQPSTRIVGQSSPPPIERESLSFLAPAEHPELLGRLGPYDVCEILGRGGMGLVLKAFDHSLNRYVAIKVLTAELASSAAARKRFAREAQAAAAVVHEHVVPIHAVDTQGTVPYLVMAYVPGRSLQERIDDTGPMDLKEILRIGFQAASGLAAAHAQGIVHRDVKPANILLENGVERVQLTDFGLARAVDDASMTQSGIIAGTPQYMSPEQAKGEPLDARADLFSLGSVLYAMATGHPPFRAENTLAVLRRICEGRARSIREANPEIPAWFDALVRRLHAPRPEDRFESAAEVASLLERCLAHVQQPAVAPLPLVLKRAAGRRWRKAALGGVALSAAAALGLAGWALPRPGAANPGSDPVVQAADKSPREIVHEERRSFVVARDLPKTGPQESFFPGSEQQALERAVEAMWLDLRRPTQSSFGDPLPVVEQEIDLLTLEVLGLTPEGQANAVTLPPETVIVAPSERNE